ncbi:GNAT family N-acetyltransferase, partial [Methylobacterium radiotolerans]|uniref:GNAT family N-acetyltransferase n=1 Tax=Methylobacterium radiotolerans TaxID=31998 RepID=UPI001FDA6E2A
PAEPVDGALAWRGAEAVGLVHHIRHRSAWTIGDYCYLQDLFVADGTRGLGIGRRLIEHVYAAAQAAETGARRGGKEGTEAWGPAGAAAQQHNNNQP